MKAKILIIIFLLILIGGLILMGIFHERVVASRDKGMATDWNADHKIQGDVDFRHYAAINMSIESRNDWPAGPALGRIIWRSDLNVGYIWNGTSWTRLGMRGDYWSCNGAEFMAGNPDTDGVQYHPFGNVICETDNIWFVAPVFLPHGAVVTGAIVYGDVETEGAIWNLVRIRISDRDTDGLASADINVEDTSIAHATIDNSTYAYFFTTSAINTDDTIYGARVTYTL